jgi:trypsin
MKIVLVCGATALAGLLGVHAAEVQNKETPEEIIPFQGRIWGGIPVHIEDYPWQGALKIQKDGNTYMCGGTVISQKWVLTAAHCLYGAQKAGVSVKTGDENYQSNAPWDAIDDIAVYKDYNSSTHEADIALIKLKVPPKGRAIPMAGTSLAVPIDTTLEVTGWGVTEKGKVSNELRMAQVPIVDNATCNAPDSYNGGVRPGMMCAGRKEGGVDSCNGDSGGPLIWKSSNGPILVGVVSFGEGCAKKLKFGVYTRVSAYRDWINSTMAAN